MKTERRMGRGEKELEWSGVKWVRDGRRAGELKMEFEFKLEIEIEKREEEGNRDLER